MPGEFDFGNFLTGQVSDLQNKISSTLQRVGHGTEEGTLAETGIAIFYPEVIFNHSFDALFHPEGNQLKTAGATYVVGTGYGSERTFVKAEFTFPLNVKVVTDDMINLAKNFVATQKAKDFIAGAPSNPVGGIIGGGTLGAGLAAKGAATFGFASLGAISTAGIGAFAGATIGWASAAFGTQEWDTPDALKGYQGQMAQLHNSKNITYSYDIANASRPGSPVFSYGDHAVGYMKWNPNGQGQYTIIEATRKAFGLTNPLNFDPGKAVGGSVAGPVVVSVAAIGLGLLLLL